MKFRIIFAMLAVSATAWTQPQENPERPTMLAGKLFTLEVTPKAKKLEVKVAGNGVVEAEMTNLGLFAKARVGGKDIVLTSVKKPEYRFEIVTPSKTEKIEIKVEAGKKSETFDIELP